MITEEIEILDYETCKLLKEFGFDEPCELAYITAVRHNGEDLSYDDELDLKSDVRENEIEYTDYEDAATAISFNENDLIELVPYSASDLEPFQKVIVRNDRMDKWIPSMFGFMAGEDRKLFICLDGWRYRYCLPYNDETSYLLGTNEDYDGYFKFW